ncbi:hypothetical protein RJG79_11550 [Mycoplasmatota bacterium WC44]
MEKNSLINVFKILNIFAGIAITVLGLSLVVFSKSELVRYMAGGMSFGVWIGIVINHFIQIPKVYGNKDERELILMIIAVSVSVSFMGVVFMILFMFSSLGNITYSIQQYWYILISVLITTLTIRYGGYKLLDKLL